MIVKMEWHREKKVSINSGALAQGKGAANVVDLVQNNQGVTGTFIIRKDEVVLQLPDDSKYGEHLYTASVWCPRPYVARLLLAAAATGTGKRGPLEDSDKLPHARVAHGVPSRTYVPVFHFTGNDNGIKQEYALIFRFYTKGEHLESASPAGTMGGGTSLS